MRKGIPKVPTLEEVKKFIRKYVKDSNWSRDYNRRTYTCSISQGLHTHLNFHLKHYPPQLEIWWDETLLYTLNATEHFYYEVMAASGNKEDIFRRNMQWKFNQRVKEENK